MREIQFAKGHGTLNDFVLFADPDGQVQLSDAQVRALCHRRSGIGADGTLRAVRASHVPEWDGDPDRWFMDYRNADGSVAEMCGNGLRVFVRYLVEQGLAEGPTLQVATRAGLRRATLRDDGLVEVTMGAVHVGGGVHPPDGRGLERAEQPGVGRESVAAGDVMVTVGGQTRAATAVDVGNPHAVVFVAPGALDSLDLTAQPTWEPWAAFPRGVNIEFVDVLAPDHVRMRVHERGVGETCSCGTGVVASAAAHQACHGAPDDIRVDVPGGSLTVHLGGEEAILIGPAVIVAHGTVDVAEEVSVE